MWLLLVQTRALAPRARILFAPNPMSEDCSACGFALPEPAIVTATWYGWLLRIAIGTTTFTSELVLAGEISPKFMVTDRLLSTLELPVTDPLSAPEMVG